MAAGQAIKDYQAKRRAADDDDGDFLTAYEHASYRPTPAPRTPKAYHDDILRMGAMSARMAAGHAVKEYQAKRRATPKSPKKISKKKSTPKSKTPKKKASTPTMSKKIAGKCSARTNDGSRCSRSSVAGRNGCCTQHGKLGYCGN
jgi:hypothetical protein